YTANMKTMISQLLADWPSAKVVLQLPVWFSSNTYAGPSSAALAYSYRQPLVSMIQTFAISYPTRVFLGDTYSYNYFATNYATMGLMNPQNNATASLGTYYLHPNGTGEAVLGQMWATAIATDLYGPAAAVAASPAFHNSFH
ncbi:MAG: SGNH/GDSL hydrolase family protein, partial [Caulobacteraceae bacterium]